MKIVSQKRYIFFLPRICNMGGAENYVNSKMRWLERNGWSADVIHYDEGKVVLSRFKERHYRIKEIQFQPYWYSKKKLRVILKALKSIICNGHYDEIVIESSQPSMAVWGELVASETGAKHILYCLEEKLDVNDVYQRALVRFKYARKEIAGIDIKAFQYMMKSCDLIVPEDEACVLKAYSDDVVEDYHHPMIDIIEKSSYDYVIGSIGRLEKPFLQPIISELVEYVKKDDGHKYALIMMGGTNGYQPDQRSIEELCEGVGNLKLFVTDFIYPIPLGLIDLCDFCISSAGSCWASVNAGIPTISVDAEDLKPIGVIPYTTRHSLHRDTESPRPLSEYIGLILKSRKYEKFAPNQKPPVDYSSHLEFLDLTDKNKEYCDLHSLSLNLSFIKKCVNGLIGPERYLKLSRLLRS